MRGDGVNTVSAHTVRCFCARSPVFRNCPLIPQLPPDLFGLDVEQDAEAAEFGLLGLSEFALGIKPAISRDGCRRSLEN